MMKSLFILLPFLLPVSAAAQSVWEKPSTADVEAAAGADNDNPRQLKEDPKYLEGAVPEKDGKVVWTLDVDVPGKTAAQIYDTMLKCLTDLTKTENQLEGSCVALVNKQEHIVVANIREWLVFTDKLLVLDRTRFHYTLIAYCADGHLKLTMDRLTYRYDEDRTKFGTYVYKAEEWITDKEALNRSKTGLRRASAKFRRKTIDRKDYLFDVIREAVLKP